MSSFPFAFGAGANFDFQGVPPAEAALKKELGFVKEALADAHAQNGRLGEELAAATAEAKRIRTAESVARAALAQLQRNFDASLRAEVQKTLANMDVDYDRGVVLEKENKEQKETITRLHKNLAEAKETTTRTTVLYETLKDEADTYKKRSGAAIERLQAEVEHHKTFSEEVDRNLNKAYADLQTYKDARLNLIEEKDKAEAHNKDWELQFNDLHDQWQEAQARIEELEDQQNAIGQLEDANHGLESDIERLQAAIADHERTLIVKDERIAHLENQYQKERQRNLNAADAAAAAAATSPIDEAPPSFTTLGDTLQDELDAASEDLDHVDDEHEHEQREFSVVIEIADITPIEPASRPARTIDVNEAANISPVAAVVPELTFAYTEAVSVAPVERQINTTNAGAQTDAPALTTELLHDATFAISPIAPVDIATATISTQTDAPALTTELLHDATFAISPIAPVNIATTTIFTQTEAPQLTSSFIDAASIAVPPIEAPRAEQSSAGVQTEAPKLSTNILDTASFAISPVEIEAQKLTSHMIDTATLAISPIEAERKPISSVGDVMVTFEEQPVEAERKPISSIGDVKVTLDEQPVEAESKLPTSDDSKRTLGDIKITLDEQPVEARPSKASTASTAAQTTETPTAPSPVIVTPKRSGLSFLQAVLPVVSLLLAISCLHFYIELDSWRYANGVGYTYSNSGRTGAFGNGRYLFGYIPIAMDIGDTWWEEQLARWMSMAIKSFEDWAGFDYRPLY